MDAFTLVLLPLSWIYGLAVAVRNKCYDWMVFPSHSLGRPTISVGNLSVGGTGKTPLVGYIAQYLQERHKRVAILSRGYKRESSGFVLVADGQKVLVNSKQSGDECQELAQRLPGAIIAVDEKRVRAAREVLKRFPVDVFLLDDGFQHRSARRELDLVTIPVKQSKESSSVGVPRDFLLPAGTRREPLTSLQRADHVVLTRAEGLDSAEGVLHRYQEWCRRYTLAELSAVRTRASSLLRVWDGQELTAAEVREKKLYLFCGIGRPSSFFDLVAALGAEIVGREAFPDHHWYTRVDLVHLERLSKQKRCDYLVTTMKDAARLTGIAEAKEFLMNSPVLGLKTELEFIYGSDVFHQHLDRFVS